MEWIKKYQTEIKKNWYIPLLIFAGILLMLRPSGQAAQQALAGQGASDENQEYLSQLENKVEKMLLDIEGAGECKVTISLASAGAYEYVREDGKVLVIRDEKGKESPVPLREKVPEIAGVTVASSAAESAAVRSDIVESVATLLGIGSNKIFVVMRNYGE